MVRSQVAYPFAAMLSLFYLVSVAASLVLPALSAPADNTNTVQLSYGSFQGISDGKTTSFLGMPYAQAPFGDLRFAPPQPPLNFSGVRQAFTYGSACPQQNVLRPIIPGVTLPNITLAGLFLVQSSEDCLFINVIRPASMPAGKQLPVVFWIFGGGFVLGDSSNNPGHPVVERSIALGEPVIHVSVNYRVNAFGFLPGKEAKAAGIGNAGLRDQRFALQWVQKNIAAFGGDPTKVTIWGESAGAISVGLQMVANNGDPAGLFRGAFMESGSPVPSADITSGQGTYDQLVADTGCTGAADTLKCLRSVSFKTLQAAVDNSPGIFSYQSLQIGYRPLVDGDFLKLNPQDSVAQGLYAKIPFISGDCDDEGTLFSLSTLNVTTNQQFLDYISTNYLIGSSASDVASVAQAYPDDVTQGSPFDTGFFNALTPQFKRLAAFQGDVVFQAPRRFFMQAASKTQPTWAFLYKRGKAIPFLGTFHASDIPEFYSSLLPDFTGTDALVNFAYNLDPNVPSNPFSFLSAINWPKYSSSTTAPPMLAFLDPAPLLAIVTDTYRADSMNVLTTVSRKLFGSSN